MGIPYKYFTVFYISYLVGLIWCNALFVLQSPFGVEVLMVDRVFESQHWCVLSKGAFCMAFYFFPGGRMLFNFLGSVGGIGTTPINFWSMVCFSTMGQGCMFLGLDVLYFGWGSVFARVLPPFPCNNHSLHCQIFYREGMMSWTGQFCFRFPSLPLLSPWVCRVLYFVCRLNLVLLQMGNYLVIYTIFLVC